MSCQSSKGYAKTACCDTHATLLAPDAASDRSSDLLQALLADEKDADAGVEHDVPHDSTLSLSAGRARADPSSSQALAMPSLSSFDVVFQCLSGRFQVVEHNGHLDFVVKGRLIHVQREACDNGCCEKGTAFDHGPAVKESGSAASSGDVVLQVFGGTKETTRIYCGGICCPSEVPIVNRAIGRLPGVVSHKVAVVSRTVVVEHNASLISGDELVDTLNRAGLEASLASEAKRRLGGDAKLIEGKDWLVVVSGILLVAAVLHYIPGAEHLKWFALGSVALALPSIAYKAVLAMRLLVIDINMLMLLAIAGALALQEFTEAAAVAFLFGASEMLEQRALARSRAALAEVIALAPEEAELVGGKMVGVEELSIGDLVAIKPGTKVSVDVHVVRGVSKVDESILTGEAAPVNKSPGDLVSAGTTNLTGYMECTVTASAEDSAVAKMARLVEDASMNRSRAEKIIEQFAMVYTPLVVLAAILTAAVPCGSGSAECNEWLHKALVLLVTACPCALVLATPVSAVSGVAAAARRGILIKGSSALEAMAGVRAVALDKTGTLTTARFEVLGCHLSAELVRVHGRSVNLGPEVRTAFARSFLLQTMAALESRSPHPIAAAIVRAARDDGADDHSHNSTAAEAMEADYENIPGEGVCGVVSSAGKERVYAGNRRLAERLGWLSRMRSADKAVVQDAEANGASVIYAGTDADFWGTIVAADEPRESAGDAVADLGRLGVVTEILTGDSAPAACRVARLLGIEESAVHASLAPGDKLALVREGLGCRREGKVMMLGDGINDAPALAAGRVGVAMGVAGSAVAMETAEVSLMTNDLTMVPLALRIAFYCRAVIWGNIGFAVVVKIAVVAISFSSNHAKLWMAILADVMTSLLVILVGLTPLYRFQKKARHSRAERKAFFDAYDGDEHELGGHGHGHGHEHSHHAGANECCGNAGTNDCCHDHDHEGHGHEHSHHTG
ncbi:hypothetical protein PPROV_000609900 [Pycnococcus provasolii]|uniref:HMA domain-containing protein n=1 Tax=Pycnococcus provasolii TaxID=41880 RepID=A0A830HKE6_9CHLO|nr:hypothetical protein PPROV_000609900 [Pycnococcus provasolii]